MPSFRSVAPGGFINASNMPPEFEYDPVCHFCFATGLGWIHFKTNTFVCRYCLDDPWADDGERGRKMARRLEGEPSTDEKDTDPDGHWATESDEPPAPIVTSRIW